MKLLPVAVLALALPTVSVAKSNDYQNELSFTYMKGELDNNDPTASLLSLTHHFDKVSEGDGPYREQAFLQRSGGATVHLGYNHFDFESGTNLSGPTFGLSVVAIFDKSPLIVSADYLKLSLDSEQDYPRYYANNTTHSIAVGSYLGRNTAFTLGYSTEKTDAEEKLRGGRSNIDSQTDDSIILTVKHLAELSGDRYLHIQPTVTQTEVLNQDELTVELDLGFYLNRSAQFSWSLGRNFETEITSASVGFEYFVTPDAAFSLLYSDDAISDSDVTDSFFAASVSTRF